MSWQPHDAGQGVWVSCFGDEREMYPSGPLAGLHAAFKAPASGFSIYGDTSPQTHQTSNGAGQDLSPAWVPAVGMYFYMARRVATTGSLGFSFFRVPSWMGLLTGAEPVPMKVRVADHVHLRPDGQEDGFFFFGFTEVSTTFGVMGTTGVRAACGFMLRVGAGGASRTYVYVTDGEGGTLLDVEIPGVDATAAAPFLEIEVRSEDRTVEWRVDGELVHTWQAPDTIARPVLPGSESTFQPGLSYIVRPNGGSGTALEAFWSPFAMLLMQE